jgi:putative transposase
VGDVRRKLGVSERRACRALKQPRATQRYRPRPREFERRLTGRMLELVREHPRFGYRRIWALLRREGWRVNRKRIYRLWRGEGLKVPRKQRKKRHLGQSAHGCARRRAEYKDHVWAWDFIHDRTRDGRPLKWLTLLDEYTREDLALEVGRRMRATDVIDVLVELFALRGVPKHIRSDNGPEFIAEAIRRWLACAGVETLYIKPGSPWENGYAESFNSRFRDELLAGEEFESVAEARASGVRYRLDYNHRRPHSALGYQTPAEFAAGCAAASVRPTASLRQQHSQDSEYSPLPVTQPMLS